MKKLNKDERKMKITLTISPRVLSKYKLYCKENGMNVSKRIELLMNNELMNNELKKKETKTNENRNN